MDYKEKDANSRNDVIRIANEIITYLQRNKGKIVTIVWGDKDSIKFLKTFKSAKFQPKMTDHELRKDIVNYLKQKFNLGKQIE